MLKLEKMPTKIVDLHLILIMTASKHHQMQPSGGSNLAVVPGSNVEKMEPKSLDKYNIKKDAQWQWGKIDMNKLI